MASPWMWIGGGLVATVIVGGLAYAMLSQPTTTVVTTSAGGASNAPRSDVDAVSATVASVFHDVAGVFVARQTAQSAVDAAAAARQQSVLDANLAAKQRGATTR